MPPEPVSCPPYGDSSTMALLALGVTDRDCQTVSNSACSEVAWPAGPGVALDKCEGRTLRPEATSWNTVPGSSCIASVSSWVSVLSVNELASVAIDVPPTIRVKGEEWVLARLAMPLANVALAPSSPPAMTTETLASAPSTKSCCQAHWKGEFAVGWPVTG